ncbi:zinc ABC transporter ATP-binding protein AztA [Arthrobacter sp. SLBN-53]|uniref:zinc ABC transporter ATP-binding protein AztA n=1 Tax=Arthrobacter sp. SLBN-53 TaxID=2768412 RepID=UPI001151C610|nr:zinc ABC transporter ATP-binding protein AztA [Arthrobacter sp. SLBN-53]TQK29123.1 zinc/manganese transport system ATP-binding protein [Arthrobacter sp. SLBN-53]
MTIIFNKAAPLTSPIYVSSVSFGYSGTTVFRDLTLSVMPATVTAIVGSNGCGKSTLLALLAGIHAPDTGTVDVAATDIAFAVQRSAVTDSFPLTAAEAVMMGRWRRLGLLRRPRATDRAVVEHCLIELGLADLRDRTLGELSGGQRQRVLLAQAFAQQAPLVLLDEPTTGLDEESATAVIGHLTQLAAAGSTIIAATHDPAVIAAAHHRIDLDEHRCALG